MKNEDRIRKLTDIFANPTSFLEFVKIQEPGELSLDYALWAHLEHFYEALESEKLIILVKSKQIGISWSVAVRALRKILTNPGSNILMLSSGQKESQKLLGKVKIIWNNLPQWMKCYQWDDDKYFTLEPNSTEQFGIKEMGSMITALPSTEKAGIGETSDWVIHDEADFHDFFETNLGHTLATVSDKPERKLTVVSTIDITKPDSYFKRLYKGAKGSGYSEAGSNNFKALFYPYNVRPNRDEIWFKEREKENEATPWVVGANFPRSVEEALSPLSALSCFNKDKLDLLWSRAAEPEVRQGFIYILYPPRVGTQYVAGVDVGEGVGLDYSCLTIVGKEGLNSEVVAVIYTNTLGTDSFAFECDRLCREYYNGLLCVDNIGIGRAVSDKLVELGYPNLFHGDTEKRKVGWALTKPNKRELAVKLVESINNGRLITKFKPQIKELMEYQWIKGYPEPTGKTHGDTVISLMFANEMLKRTRNNEKAKGFANGVQIW